ncbi:MAG TPA: type IV pilus secretin PilQ [Nitrospirales bacterium]|nr:type IV pilus secretin PilQ [Nitrospirales bacterium]
MKTQLTGLGVLVAGLVMLGILQACAPTEPMVEPTVAETAPTRSTETPAQEMTSAPADASKSVPESRGVQSAVETVPPALIAAGTSSGNPLPPAKSMTDLTVQRTTDSVVVVITGDGDLTYEVTKLSGNRLVIDLMNVVNGTKRKTVPVGHQFMQQIRIGVHQFPQPKVRLVLDLRQTIPYTIEKTGAQLRVTLSEQALVLPAPQGTQTMRRPAPTPAERVARMSPRSSVPVPVPDRLKFLDTMAPLAQPRLDQPASTAPLGGNGQFTGKRISLDFQEAEISSVLRLIADVSGLNMVVGEAVKAKVTLKLLNVPWDQALDLILKLNNLGQIREGNILWIDTLANITKLRDDATRAKEATLKAEELVTRIVYLNYSDAAKSIDVAKSNLSPRGEIKVDARTNALVIRDIPDNLTKVEKIIRDLDQRTPQVQIEARIVQASKNFSRGLGIQWGIGSITKGNIERSPLTVNLGASGLTFGTQTNDFLVNLPASASGVTVPGTTAGFLIGKFFGTTGTLDLRLSAGEALGQTKIVSAPKIITLDNKPAKLEQGSQIPFSTVSLQGTQTTFVDATLTLNVTPHVIPHADTVRLEIKVTKNALGAVTVTAGPTIDKKEATSEILLKDGETTVLGGIFEENRSDSTQGVPWFNRIPFLGWLFKNEGVSVNQTELLVFVTPTIIKE